MLIRVMFQQSWLKALIGILVIANCYAILPRYGGSEDLGSYEFWTCTGGTGTGEDRTCEFNQDEGMNYAIGVGLYAGLSIFFLVMFFLVVLSCCFGNILKFTWRLLSCCCRKKKVDENGNAIEKDFAFYTKRDKIRMMMFFFTTVGILISFMLSHYMGNVKLSENASGMMDAPAGLQHICMNTEPSLSTAIIGVYANVLVPFIFGFNKTLNLGFNMHSVVEDFGIINSTWGEMPQMSVLQNIAASAANLTVDVLPPLHQMVGNFSELNGTMLSLNASALELLNFTNELIPANDALVIELSHTNTTLYAVDDLMVYMVGSSDGDDTKTGLIQGISSDLDSMSRSPAGSVPTTTEFSTAYDEIVKIIDTTYYSDSSGINNAVTELTAIYDALQALPNYNTTAANLIIMSDKIAEVTDPNGLLNQLAGNLTAINDAVDNYPSFASAADIVVDLNTTVTGITIAPIVNIIDVLIDIVNVIPSLIDQTHQELFKLTNVSQTELDAILDIVNQVYSFNETIMKPSSSIFDYVEDANKELNMSAFNDTLYDYLNQILDANVTFTNEMSNATDYRDQASDMDDSLRDATQSFDINGIVDSLYSADDLMNEVNLTATSLLLSNFATSLSEISVPSELTDELISFQIQLDNMGSLLKRVVNATMGGPNGDAEGDFIQLAKGYCSDVNSVSCTSDSDCTAGTCNGKGVYRCSANPTTTCTADSTCDALTANSYCLMNSDSSTTLAAYLNAFSSSSADVVVDTTLLDDLANAASNNNLDVPGAISSINSASDSITAYNISNAKGMIESMLDSLGSVDIVEFIDQMNDVIDQIDGLNASDYVDRMDPLVENQGEVYGYYDDMIYFKNFFFEEENLKAILQSMDINIIQEIRQRDGPNAAIYYANSKLDNITYYFHSHKRFKKYISQSHLAEDNEKSYKFLDKLGAYEQSGYGDMKGNGATYYFMRLFGLDQVRDDDAKMMGVVANSDGERYPDDKFCYTNACDDHTSEVLNTQPMSTWSAEFPGYAFFETFDSIDYTREEVFTILWIPPLMVAFLSIFVALFNWKYQKPWLKNCCTFTFSACVMIQLPFVLLLTALLFPFSIMMSDICDSGSGVGHSYITSYGDDMCTVDLSGEGTLSSCTIVADMGSSNFTLDLDILGLYDGLIAGKCSHSSPENDPFAKIFYSIADQIDAQVQEQREDNFATEDYRYAMNDLLDETVTNVASIFSDFFNQLGDEPMSCESIAAISRDFSGATCGSFMTPTLWFLGGWFLASWILVLCAFPFGCLKRYMVDKAIESLDDEGGEGAGAAANEETDIKPQNSDDSVDLENVKQPSVHEPEQDTSHKSDNEEIVDAQLAGIPVADDTKMKSFEKVANKSKPKPKIVVGRHGVISSNRSVEGEKAMTEWKDSTKEEVFL